MTTLVVHVAPLESLALRSRHGLRSPRVPRVSGPATAHSVQHETICAHGLAPATFCYEECLGMAARAPHFEHVLQRHEACSRWARLRRTRARSRSRQNAGG